MFGGKLEDAVTNSLHRVGNTKQLIRLGICAWHKLAVLAAMQRRARRRKTECSCAQCLFGDCTHLCNVVGCCILIGGTAVTHHKCPKCTVRNLCAHVEHVGSALKGVQIFGERSPFPFNALHHCGAGNIFNSFHEVDKPLMALGCCWSKTNSAIAHHNRSNSMPTAWCQPWIPCCLSVVMRVHIDPSWSEQQSIGIYVAMCMSSRNRSWLTNFGNDAINKCNIGVPCRRTGAINQIGSRNDGSLTGLHNCKI